MMTSTAFYKNNNVITYSSNQNVDNFGIYRIGSSMTTSSNYYIGDIYEIIAYNRVLTDLERAQLNNYLTVKWGI